VQPRAAELQAADIRYPGLDRLAWRLFVVGLVLLVGLSPHALISLGYPYEAPLLGPFPFKVHPGTYVMIVSLLCSLGSRGNPIRAGLRLAWREPLMAFFLVVMVVTLVWVVVLHGTSGAAFIVDTHWMPAIVAFGLMCFGDERRRKLLWLLAALIGVNAVIALTEFALQQRLTPLFVQSQVSSFANESLFRSSALFGHPLVNAKATAAMLAIATFLPLRPFWRWLHVVLLMLSMLAFGGRFALVTTVALYGAWALVSLARDTLRGRFSYLQLTGGSVLLMLGLASLIAFVAITGLGERIFTGLQLDKSASVRLTVFSAYDYVTAEQLWFGTSAREIDLVALRLGLDPVYEAIENSWIYLSLQLGLILFSIWLAGFVCFLIWLLRQAPSVAVVGVLVYMLNASTTNTLAAKTITLGLLVVFVMGAAAHHRANLAASQRSAQVRASFSRNSSWSRPAGRVGPFGADQPRYDARLRGQNLVVRSSGSLKN
jgi:hypothetical protein